MFKFEATVKATGEKRTFETPSMPAAIDEVFGKGSSSSLVRSGNARRITLTDPKTFRSVGAIKTLNF